MAVMEAGEPKVIPNSEGNRTTPSIVAFGKDGERLVELANQQSVRLLQTWPIRFFQQKDLLGESFRKLKDEISTLPFKVVEGKNGAAVIECDIDGKARNIYA